MKDTPVELRTGSQVVLLVHRPWYEALRLAMKMPGFELGNTKDEEVTSLAVVVSSASEGFGLWVSIDPETEAEHQITPRGIQICIPWNQIVAILTHPYFHNPRRAVGLIDTSN